MAREELLSAPAIHKFRTLLALGLANFVDQAEAVALPTLFPAIMAAWGLTELHLGTIASVRNFLQTAGGPFWGYAADRFSRKQVLILGAGLWGMWTLACGLAGNYTQLLVLRALSGLGLACLLPGAFALIADHFQPQERGRALGTLGFLGVFGVVGGVLTMGWVVEAPGLGWRWGFILLGLASVASGGLMALFVDEPPRGAAEPELAALITYEDAQRFSIRPAHVARLLRIPTMWAIFLQGIPGSIPWVVMGAMMMTWMITVRGVSYGQGTVIMAGLVVGAALSHILGGYLGDRLARWSPRYGRILLAQISVLGGIPLTILIFTHPLAFTPFFVLAFATALVIGWAGPGAKEPIMGEVVVPELRASAYSLDGVVEGGLAASGAFIAGFLAQRYGLTRAMLLTVPLPWGLCLLAWCLFYWTYPADAMRLRAEMARRREEL
ncbi:MAG: MFS transporter [Anaerolineae bacterium]